MKKLLKKKYKRIKISSKVKRKIEKIHRVKIEDVLENLKNPFLLEEIEEQPARRSHDKTYKLLFKISKRKRLFIVVTFKFNKNKIFVVTALKSTKKIEKLIKKPKVKRVYERM